ncbi:DUF4160 domain-containing protein [Paraburkholderia sp. RL18-103-BIB-C]|jgi:hypothetical protein|uniref:DUF4160 domain-containing protein n=1 Tax=Paraburkholderia sp. RL18-103-BIB-C TaxID=3031637 RepID=UPI0038BBA78F
MPTIATINGYRVVIYTADHRPAHVHVIGAGFEIVFNLNCPNGPLDVRNIAGKVSDRTIYRIASLIEPEIVAFCAAWRKHHGHY